MRYRSYIELVAGVVFAAGIGSAAEAFEVKKPKVHEGEVEVEYHGASFADQPDDAEEKLRHSHEIEVSAGLTRYWKLGVAGELEKAAGEDFDLAEMEIINTFLLRPDYGDGFTAALFAAAGTKNGDPSSAIELGPIFQFTSGPLSLLTNTFLPYEFNTEEGDFWAFEYAVQAKYDVSENWGIGAEAYGEIEDLGDAPPLDEQEHRVGPVLYWSPDRVGGHSGSHHSLKGAHDMERHGPAVSSAVGVLFGLTDATNDVTLKWDVEVEF